MVKKDEYVVRVVSSQALGSKMPKIKVIIVTPLRCQTH